MNIISANSLLEISRNFMGHRLRRDENWHGYTNGQTWGALLFAVSNLYRGQNEHHFPMLPSIGRGLDTKDIRKISQISISDQAKLILRQAQSLWFHKELNLHPVATHAKKIKVDLNEIALAQHYGIPTGYLDLTDDFNVSAFFATCKQTNHGWEPLSSGTGIIYRASINNFKTPFGEYAPLGPQPLPRPTEQCAWVTELPIAHSFEGWPGVSILKFEHDRTVGEHFLEMFNGGSKLFPIDPLAEVADEIMACGEIPIDFVDMILQSYVGDPLGPVEKEFQSIRSKVAELAVPISYRRLLTTEQIADLLANPIWTVKMLANVTANWRAVRRIPIEK